MNTIQPQSRQEITALCLNEEPSEEKTNEREEFLKYLGSKSYYCLSIEDGTSPYYLRVPERELNEVITQLAKYQFARARVSRMPGWVGLSEEAGKLLINARFFEKDFIGAIRSAEHDEHSDYIGEKKFFNIHETGFSSCCGKSICVAKDFFVKRGIEWQDCGGFIDLLDDVYSNTFSFKLRHGRFSLEPILSYAKEIKVNHDTTLPLNLLDE